MRIYKYVKDRWTRTLHICDQYRLCVLVHMNRNEKDHCHWNLNEELKTKAERTGNMKNDPGIQMN